ncbi:MAG: putative bifunctional diguanylate cyclase/phosphodiesterase [Acidiferrobacterales bacterium]
MKIAKILSTDGSINTQLLDPLTGLKTRTAFRDIIESQLKQSNGTRRPFGLIMLDLDRFKVVNYGYGEHYGDLLLQQIADLLVRSLRKIDQISRWGGQEYLCLLPDTDAETMDTIAEDLRQAIESSTLEADNCQIHTSASFGVACYPHDGTDTHSLIAASGAAMYHAKNTGRNRVTHASELHGRLFGLGKTLDAALRDFRVIAAYQPIVDLKTGEVVAEEALARIVTPEQTIMPAGQFIEAACQLQMTYQIDRAVITSVFTRCMQQLRKKPNMAHFVNVSGNLLRHPKVVTELLHAAQETCLACGDLIGPVKPLVIEITERELLDDIEAARNMLRPFIDFGLRLALDDFGSGFSSFKYLADLPFTFLKIEGSLIQRITEKRVRVIVQDIQKTATDLGLITLAEFIETEETANIAREIGIDWAQGYYYGKPEIPGD